MSKTLKILLLEDIESDVELAIRELKSSMGIFDIEICDNEDDFTEKLVKFSPDIIISDYQMPTFNGLRALEITKKSSPFTPFIILTGSLNEDTAVDCMKAGAEDYVIKEHIKRLGVAVKNALKKKEIALERHTAISALADSEEKYRSLIENLGEGVVLLDKKGRFTFVNKAAMEIFELSANEFPEKYFYEFCGKAKFNEVKNKIYTLNKFEKLKIDISITTFNNTQKFLTTTITQKFDENGNFIGTFNLFRDITNQRKSQNTVLKLAKAVEQSPNSIIITNMEGAIEYINPSFSILTGYSKNETIGKKPNLLKSGLHTNEFYATLWSTILSGKTWKGEFRNKKKSGELYWEEAIISPIMSTEGEITHLVSVKQDVTQNKQLMHDLIIAKEKAEESDRLKSAFLANVSHEIRTPMNGILGFSELLKSGDLSELKRHEYVEIIEVSGKRMLNIINELIDISRIESGQIQLNLEHFPLDLIIDDLYKFFLPQAKQKKLKFEKKTQSNGKEVSVFADRHRLTQIMTNLIENSIKFTHEGYVNFGYTLSNDLAILYVTDSGIGIANDLKEKIFGLFQQADDSYTRSYDGAGLGLSISKALVEMHHGKIEVESETGKGSTFSFSIPLSPNLSIEQKTPKGLTIDNLSWAKGATILITEDDPISFKLIQEIIELAGINVFWAQDGLEAVNYVKSNPGVDLILMDLKMPNMDGYEALEIIKQMLPNVPIFAQTAFAQNTEKRRALYAGFDAFLTKPLITEELLTLINKHLKNRKEIQ